MWLTSTGIGSCPASPRGVALIATSTSIGPAATVVGTPMPLAHAANAFARAASRERTNSVAPRSAAATAVARAEPPVPTTSHRSLFPPAPSLPSAAVTPKTSVLSPIRAPPPTSSVQNVLHAPTRAQTSVFRVTDRSTASLCGTVTLPAPRVAACIASTSGSSLAETRSATYTASRPSARNAALYIVGEREWATGSPMTVSRRVLALISTLAFGGEPVGDGGRELFELKARVTIHFDVPPERIADLVGTFAVVFAEHEDFALATQLIHARAMVPRHRQNQIGLVDELAGEQPGAMAREIESAFEPDEVGALGDGRPVPRARARGRHLHFQAPVLQ